MAKVYSKPPIIEAICEFQFYSVQEWDWTIPGLVYNEIHSEFPEKREERAFEINVAPQENKLVQRVGNALTKMQFVRLDGTAMVQVGPDLLGINVRAPYPGWNDFIKMIATQFEIYLKIVHPKSYKRIGLRYINRMEFATDVMELTEYFHYYPHIPPTIEQRHGPFAMRVMHEFAQGRDSLNVNFANIAVPSKKLAYVLDLDYSLLQPDKVELGKGIEWIVEAHRTVEVMFEACITDKTRAFLGEQK